MSRRARTLENALYVLSSVLDRQQHFTEAFDRHGLIARLVVVHAVVHSFPRAFFVPDTTSLLQPYPNVLDFLVGDFTSDVMGLVGASADLKWHERAEPLADRRSARTCLVTPPEVLELLAKHPNTAALMTDLFVAARWRLERHNADAEALAERQARAAKDAVEAVQRLFETGGHELSLAVYKELKKIFGQC
jgi:hypothetical protein